MTYVREDSYREIPFCPETRYSDFNLYVDLKDIVERCECHADEIMKCRTIGILQSLSGRFYLTDFNSTGADSKPLVQVSVVYLQSPPMSTVIPYPVQIFGTVQWKNRPVMFAKILQTLNTSTALRLKNALNRITTIHLAKSAPIENEDSL